MKQRLLFASLVMLAMPACAQPQAPDPSGSPGEAASASSDPDASAGPAAPAEQAPAPDPVSAADRARYEACMAGLRDNAVDAGVSAAAFDTQVDGLVPDLSVVKLLDAQPEFETAIWDYLAGLVDDERIADGRAMLERHADVLARVSDQYGVDPATVVAVWGVESDYGSKFGDRPLLTSLSTLSCFGRRQDFFRGELFSAMRILEKGDIEPGDLRGSWAGAFGHTQFMPSTFERIAVDFDGDGRRDLVGSVPDALASTAHYLDRSGWREGEPWGYEVELPDGFDASLAGRTDRRTLSEWMKYGIKRVDGRPIDLPGNTRAAVLLPAGIDGPAFLVFRNFDAIYSYNAAVSYALAIAHLSDRLRGGGAFETPWPTDDPGLSRVQRRELQELLLARGHDIGEVDGMLGTRTREAIKLEQQRLGHAPADGRGGMKILEVLRAERR
ncbi:MAG TPA: lytic murein transglycosylase [Xanthomonadaceae bacterium]|nr:lytic murein transglycosylase [Xanthomonadaceae bacterium]